MINIIYIFYKYDIQLVCTRNVSQSVGTIQLFGRDNIYISTGSYIEEYNHKVN